jgi:hypothetical protein
VKTLINETNFPRLVVRISKLTDKGLRWAFIDGFMDDEPLCLSHWMYEGKDNFDEEDFYEICGKVKLEITEMTDMEDNVILKDDNTPILCIKKHGDLYKNSKVFTWGK